MSDDANGYDVYHCPELGCPWGIAWPSTGLGADAPVMLRVPIGVLAQVGAHVRWHRRDDVRAGHVRLRFDQSSNRFVELTIDPR